MDHHDEETIVASSHKSVRRFVGVRGNSSSNRSISAAESSNERTPLWKLAVLLAGVVGIIVVLISTIFAAETQILQPHDASRTGFFVPRDSVEGPSFEVSDGQKPSGTATDVHIPSLSPGGGPRPAFLTIVASKNIKAVEAFRNSMTDVVLFDYSLDHSTSCDWCVYEQHMPGVKWELLEAFFDSDWWGLHKWDYKWLWYPDDDLVFQPGDIERLFRLVDSSHTFKVVQPSLCKGSQVSHPSMLQTEEDVMPIIHMYSVELQQPLGLVSWWDEVHKAGVFANQTFGFGLDAFWTSFIGHERHSGLVNSICAFHPFRGAGHKSGRDDGEGTVHVVRKYPTFHEIVQMNIKRWGYSNTAEFYYRSRRVHRVGKGHCEKVCTKVGICLGIVNMEECEQESSLLSVNATSPDTEAYCKADESPEQGKTKVCCACVQEDPEWCHKKYRFCNWGKSWGRRKIGVREQQGRVGNSKVEGSGRPGKRESKDSRFQRRL